MGERLFKGEDTADTLAAVIQKQLDLSKVPARVWRLLEESLQKDPRQRLRDIGDAKRMLAEAAAPSLSRRSWLTTAALAPSIAAGLGWFAWRASRPVDSPLMRFSDELGRDITPSGSSFGSQIVLSPDGNVLVATVRDADGKMRLGVRRLDHGQITPLPGTEDAYAPFFSPDGQWIAFRIPGAILKKISSQGGFPVTICNSSFGGSWGDDNSIVTVGGVGSPIFRVPPDGGTPIPITKLEAHDRAHRWPQMLPGSQAVLFTAYDDLGRDYDDSEIDVVSLETGQRRMVHRGGTYARYLPSGHLVFIHQNALFAAPFDLKRLTLAGTLSRCTENVDSGR